MRGGGSAGSRDEAGLRVGPVRSYFQRVVTLPSSPHLSESVLTIITPGSPCESASSKAEQPAARSSRASRACRRVLCGAGDEFWMLDLLSREPHLLCSISYLFVEFHGL